MKINSKSSSFEKKIENSQYRLTKPRKAVLDVLKHTQKHLSAEEIYQEVYKSYPSIGLTTVYRTLDLLNSIGMVDKFEFGDGKARFELIGEERKKPDHHHHLICVRCGKIIDYTDFIDEEAELVRKTEEELSKKHNFLIYRHIIHFYGICNECRKGNE